MAIRGTLGFLAYGNMGSAILDGLLSEGALRAENARVYEVDSERRALAELRGIPVVDSASELASQCDTIVIAVKPQAFDEAAAPMAGALRSDSLVISIMAGISIGYIRGVLGDDVQVARVMPNLPALVGAGVAAIACSEDCSEADKVTARTVFETVGLAEFVAESEMDAVTALSGSGPAYFFHMVECMASAAAALGLPEDQATRFASKTMLGAALMLEKTGTPPGELRRQVTSKGGTTAAALERFETGGYKSIVRAALDAAADRSRAMGK